MGIVTKRQNSHAEEGILLGNIKPSATRLILDGSKVDIIDIIKFTFFDLILKQVLIVKKEFRKAHPRDASYREYVIVETGKKFSQYKFDPFESYFVNIIDKDSFYNLRGYLRKVYKDLPSNYKCYRQIIEGSGISHNFHSNLITQIFKLTLLNGQGKTFRKEVAAYLEEIDNKILDLLNNDPEEALKIVSLLKGNIFLLKKIKFELIEKLKPLSRAMSRNHADYDDVYDMFYMDNHVDELFDIITNAFESIDDFFNDNTSFDDWGDTDIDF